MKPIVLEKHVKFCDCDPRLNRSGDILLEAVGRGIFDSFFRYTFRPEVDNDVISDVTADYVSMVVNVKLGDSRSNDFQRYSRDWFRVANEISKPIT